MKREAISSRPITVDDIGEIRNHLKSIPGADLQNIDKFADILYNFLENATDAQVLEGVVYHVQKI